MNKASLSMEISNFQFWSLLFLANFMVPIHCHGYFGHSNKNTALFIFGDSYFDSGNNNYINTTTSVQANFRPYGETFFKYPTGRFSDGRIIPDFIAEYANLPLIQPYLLPGKHQFEYGANFASAAAGALVETFQGLDAITNVKQQCSDFVMTRNIQCREMIEDVQRQMAGLSFQDGKNTSAYNYPSVGHPHQPQRTTSQHQTEPMSMGPPHPQTPYYQPPEQPPTPMPAYSHNAPPYGAPQQPPPPYQVPSAGGSPYPPPPQHHQQPLVSHEYGQPAYPGWRGPYYNAHAQQQGGSLPRPPYTVQSPYPPPHQSGYYKQ